MFEIEKNIPMPMATKKIDMFPFDNMETGDSFFVPFEEGCDVAHIKRYVAGAISDINFRNSVVAGNGETRVNRKGQTLPAMTPIKKWSMKASKEGIRVWRIL